MEGERLPKILDLAKVLLVEPKLIGYQVSRLTQPGDNYGSFLLAIRVELKRADNDEVYVEELVGKVPPLDAKFWEFIQPEITCRIENAIYQNLAPALKKLQVEAGLPLTKHFDGFARYYGSRISLDGGQVDHNAILLLENLRAGDYQPGQRLKPFDLPHTLLALRYMAQFHALPIALRMLKPQTFDLEIRQFFGKFDWHAAAPVSKTLMKAETLEDIRKATQNNEILVARIQRLADEFFEFLAAPTEQPNGHFTSIIHCDYWINNLMFKYDSESGLPVQMKIIDFQTAQYDSVVHDIIAFLLSSVDTNILEVHYEHLLESYYKAFISCLEGVGVDTANAYSYVGFRAELKRVAYLQVPHAIFMTRFILAGDKKENELELDDVLKDTGATERIQKKLKDILRLAEKFDILF